MEENKEPKSIAFVSMVASIGYIIGCFSLYAISIWIFGSAIWNIFKDVGSEQFSVYKLLDEVGLIVFSIAVIDVCKYLMVEEVLKRSENRQPYEERQALSKFIVIIVTALSLKGLVLTIEAAKIDIRTMIYPVSLFVTGTLLLVGLGVYQRLNISSEEIAKKSLERSENSE